MVKVEGEWKEIGHVGVNSGMCWLGDPAQVLKPENVMGEGKDWADFSREVHSHPDFGANEFPKYGVAVVAGYGDGKYPVMIKRNEDGRISEVRIVFIPEGKV